METLFILAQVSHIISLVGLVTALQFKNKNITLVIVALADVFLALGFLFLASYSGAALAAIAVVRSVTFAVMSKKQKNIPVWILIFFLIAIVVSTILTWDNNYFSILLALGLLAITYGYWQHNIIFLRACSMFMSACAMVYSISVLAYVNTVKEVLLVTSAIISIVRFRERRGKTLGLDENILIINEKVFNHPEEDEHHISFPPPPADID